MTKKWLMLILLSAPLAQATETLDQLVSIWTEKKFEVVLPRLLEYRKQPFGRKWQVDYMIGTSDCHGAGDRRQGVAYLGNVFTYSAVPDAARTAAEEEIKFCLRTASADQPQEPSFYMVPVSGQLTNPASVRGKGGYNEIDANAKVTTTGPKPTPVSIEELQKRVFPPDQSKAALAAAMARLKAGRNPPAGVVLKGFVLVNTPTAEGGSETPMHFGQTADCLDRFRQPLQAQFNMQLPADLITVYIADDLRAISMYAAQLHGVQLPLGTFAYSVLEDLSIVGIIAGGCGSLAHELTHLAIKSNFGDSPAWLEEGLASEIAVGSPNGDTFRFGPSWRDSTLRQHWELRPKVSKLISMNWADFAATDAASVPSVAATHAMAAVFVRYLYTKQKLNPVYFALRDNRFSADSPSATSDKSILERELGHSLAEVDDDFVAWFGHPAARPASHAKR